MTVDSVERGADPEVLKLGLSDGSSFFLRTSYLPQPLAVERLFVVGGELGEEDEAVLRLGAACFRAERAALTLIARSEQYTSSLSRKLEQRGHERRIVQTVMERLLSLDLVNDCRYAEMWVESRLSRVAEGPGKLAASLQARGIPRTIAAAAVRSLIDSEGEVRLLYRYAEKKSLDLGENDFTLRSRLGKAGFSSRAIRTALERRD